MKQLIVRSIFAAKNIIDPQKRKSCFEIFGYDFIIDEDFNLWLIEVNTNPYIKQKFPHIFIVLVPFYWKNRVRFLIIMRFSLEVRKEYVYRKFKHIVYHSWKIYLQDV